ncbi:uncharacterized protein LOC131384243 [Hylobates moloch]|uniref:uncharacterized protein LOC131384243 n=1 Tax=Hylobates moloch TaxID=81572 RepID=UPI002675F5BA|nr:uncharacterized protein LOC131384243 [Hylobates moloch]
MGCAHPALEAPLRPADPRNPKHAAHSPSSALTAGSLPAFLSLNSHSWASLETAAAVTSAGRAGTVLFATSLPVPRWGRARVLPWQVRPRGHPEPEGRRGEPRIGK